MKTKLFLIALLLCIGSYNYMQKKFALENLGFMEDNFSKIWKDSARLAEFYSDTLRYKCEEMNCDNARSFTKAEFKHGMIQYYRADFVFAVAYSAIFFLILLSLFNHKKMSARIYNLFIVGIVFLFISDFRENWMMIQFIGSDYKEYDHWIPWVNVIKTALFALLSLFLVTFNIPFLLGRFYAWVRSEE